MVKTSSQILAELSLKYKAPKNKLLQLERRGIYHKVVKGLYETELNTPAMVLAASVYGPSYISFESAMEYWGLIPERVVAVTSATTCKNRRKRFDSSFGTFFYRDVPLPVFPYEVYIKSEGSRNFLIAGREKALCDRLYQETPLSSGKTLEQFLFQNLRIEENDFLSLDARILLELCPLYRSKNLKLLESFIKKRMLALENIKNRENAGGER